MVIKTAKTIDNAFIIEAIRKKLDNNHRLQRLQDYYEGRHDILLRFYKDTEKPNNRIVVNFCKNISDFLTAYVVGVPIKYEAPQIILDNLNYNDNDETTMQVVLDMNKMGFGAELFYTDSDGTARFSCIDPRETIFIFDDSIEENLIAFIRLYPKEDESEGYNVTVYSDTEYTQYDLSLSVGELKARTTTPHYFGDVPAVFYPNNRELSGTFEGIMSLQDALNKLVSDSINDWEGFVDSYLVLTGLQATQSDDVAKMRQDRILLLDGEASAEWLTKQVQHDHIKELKDSITRKIRELGALADLENLGSFGASGVALKFKLIPTDIQASKQERTIKKGIQRKLELLYNILRITDPVIGNYTDVKIEFERNFIMITDKIEEARLDTELVRDEIISKEYFLMKHKGMTVKEVQDEINLIDRHRLGMDTYPEMNESEEYTNE